MEDSLIDIPGIGGQRKKELLRRFGSLKKIREASMEELREVKGFSENWQRAYWSGWVEWSKSHPCKKLQLMQYYPYDK